MRGGQRTGWPVRGRLKDNKHSAILIVCPETINEKLRNVRFSVSL